MKGANAMRVTVIVVALGLCCNVFGQDEVMIPPSTGTGDELVVSEGKSLDSLPPIFVELTEEQAAQMATETDDPSQVVAGKQMLIERQEAVNLVAEQQAEDATAQNDPATKAVYVVGGINLTTYYYIQIRLPSYVTDVDGGTIRLIMQHETASDDQVRIIDEHIGTEFHNDRYGRRGRYRGRYGWTRQSGGGEKSWILGDNRAHNLADPWGWAWILDYRWRQGNGVLGGDWIRIYSHPHVTTRVIIKD
jgi:hypothetical protein